MEVGKKLRESRGEVSISLAIIMLIGIMLLAAVLQLHHVYVTVDHVKAKTNAAVLAVAAANVSEVYGGVRESAGSARHYTHAGWATTVSTADVVDALRISLNARLTSWTALETDSYKVSDINTRYVNEEDGNLNFTTTMTIEIPLTLGQPLIPPLTTTLEVKTTYEPKF